MFFWTNNGATKNYVIVRTVPVVTDDLLVLLAKSLAVQPVAGGKSGDAYGGGLNLPL